MRRLPRRHAAKVLACLAVLFLAACSLIKPAPKPSPQPEPAAAEQPRKEEPPAKPPAEKPAPAPVRSAPTPPPAPEKPKPVPLAPPVRVTHVEWSSVNLREGPGTSYKVVGNAKKGMSLGILEDKGQWLRVRLDDGKEAWVYKAATLPAPQPASAGAKPKPKPM